ncbi:hypothetical protein [Nocardia sp. Marseille-Q1738]
MTTLEPAPALSRWELGSAGYRIPSPAEDTVRDPAYIYARIRHALQRAEQNRSNSRVDPDTAELIALKVWLGDLTDDLKLHTAAADELLQALRAVAPDLHWWRGDSLFGHTPDAETAQKCATRLRLREARRSYSGERVWRGVYEGIKVTVHGPAQ